MVISNHLAIWITEEIRRHETEWLLRGLALDGDYGFGGEDIKYFEGNMEIHAVDRQWTVCAKVSTTHSTRIPGPLWTVESNEPLFEFPSPPFLITDMRPLECVYSDIANIDFTPKACEIFEKYGPTTIYPIGTDSWFGVLDHTAANTFWLIAFSSQKDAIRNSRDLLFLEWDFPAGQLL